MQGILIATALAMAFSLLATPWVMGVFRARGVGQLIREDGPAAHFEKHGTPTMGGLILLAAATIGYFGAQVRFVGAFGFSRPGREALMTLGVGWGLGLLGALDDLRKIRQRRSLGLSKKAKFAGQALVGFGLAFAAVEWASVRPEISWAGSGAPLLPALHPIVFAVWVVIVIAGTSNAVNLTDGLDGLAAGASAMAFFVFMIIGFWQFRHQDFYADLGNPSAALEVSIVAAAMLGACIGFLWWNAAPAKIFLGDTGSLALGGVLAALGLFTSTQLLLLVIGGLFVVETLSVIIQVVAYKVFGGRRVFAMAPLHHHFELRGWPEINVIIRFWLIAALLAGLGLALFYSYFLQNSGGVVL
ncbi:MAG TPA: phospho-N-acetylmuramoyl-pentapeptide-transferase [Actinomycetota bacterium]|nr:phospho-N-acetylmuramoyl-pentapeptide-transferase [Actinomycetota bacterium]